VSLIACSLPPHLPRRLGFWDAITVSAVLVPMLTVSSSCSAMPIDSIASIDLETCWDAILISVSNKLIAGKVKPPVGFSACAN
jgi:hypothetical protein